MTLNTLIDSQIQPFSPLRPGTKHRSSGRHSPAHRDHIPMKTSAPSVQHEVTDIKVSIARIETRIDNITSNMLSKGQAATLMLSAALVILSAGWWVIQHYLAPLLASLGR